MRSALGWLWFKLGRGASASYLAVLLVLSLLENTLIFPAPRYPAGEWNAARFQAEDVDLVAADGTKLHGWYFDHPQPQAHLLYLHGNGDCVGYLGGYLRDMRDRHEIAVFAIDYRGYGRSEGSPDEAGVLSDARAAHDWLAQRSGQPPQNIILMGRSLGGALAVDLAADRGCRGLILQNTFTSMPDVAERLYWFLPVRWLMRTQLNSADKISRYAGPVLQSHGEGDELVPIELARQLFDRIPGRKTWLAYPALGHNDEEPPSYGASIDEFLRELPRLADGKGRR
jgi:fermentation-respiration switch protein FrsA (DUF1100 family)